jgi:cephalosporin hydroxylase
MTKQLTVEEIERFIIDAGSDHVPTFGGSFEGGIQCQQVPDELAPCIRAILDSEKDISSYLEIGVAAGGTTFLIDHFFKPGKIVLIDDNRHPKAHVRAYILDGIERQEIVGRSQDQGTIDQAAGAYDLVTIDGDHSYEGVKADVDNYSPMLTSGGFLALHDSALPDWGVIQIVGELKGDPRFEFVGEFIGKGPMCGVALFRRGGNQ